MSDAPFMQLYVADYLGDTQHLTAEQHGAYLLLLMTMWRFGGSLPDDAAKLARIARVSTRRWNAIEADVMAFFDVSEGLVTNKRLSQELTKASSKSESRSASGRAGAAAKALKTNDQASANACGLLQQKDEFAQASSSEVRVTVTSREETVTSAGEPANPTFSEFWNEIKKEPTASRPKALTEWNRLKPADRKLAQGAVKGFNAYCQAHPTYTPCHPWKYLSERRFEGHAAAALVAAPGDPIKIQPETPEWDAWLDHKRRSGIRTAFMEAQGREGNGFLVPSRFPPASQVAA